jgi:hypothetical protein
MTSGEFLTAAAEIAKSRGFEVRLNSSKTTASDYLLIGTRSASAGIETLIECRVSDHSKFGTPSGLHAKMRVLHVRSNRPARVYTEALAKLATYLDGCDARPFHGCARF